MDTRNRSLKFAARMFCVVFFLVKTFGGGAQKQPLQKFQQLKQPLTAKAIAVKELFTSKKDVFGFGGSFIENIGQYSMSRREYSYMGDIQFGFQGFDLPVLFTKKGLILLEKKPKPAQEKENADFDKEETENGALAADIPTTVTTIQWVNSNPNAQFIAEDECQGSFGFGLMPKSAKGFKKITCKNIYPGIDISYFFNKSKKMGFEYSIMVSPGADLSKVKMLVKAGAAHFKPTSNGSLRLQTAAGGFEQSGLAGYYGNDASHKLKVNFTLKKDTIGFAITPTFDKTKALVIDPFISPVSTLTGTNAGKAKDIDFDYAGNIYVGGGGDGNIPQMLAKYDASGVLQWTFSGVLANPS